MSQNYQQGAVKSPKEPTINRWEGQGIVRTRSGNDGDEIKFFPFQKGGGAIHITVACTEVSRTADENGQPKTVTSYVPVNVMTNKNISDQQLMSVRPGMKVRVVGKLQPESYTSKKTGSKVTTMVVNAFVFEILEMPQPGFQPGYQPQPGYAPQGGYAPYPYGGQPQPGYMPPQGGYPQQGYQPQAAPQYYPQGGGYPPPPNYGPGMQGAAPAGGQPLPPYYQPPGYMPPQGGAPAPQGPAPGEDLPPDTTGKTINV